MTEPEGRTRNQERFGKGAKERARVRAEQAWALREAGLSYREIGRRLQVSHVTIKTYLDKTEDRISKDMEKVARRVLARDLAQVEAILSEAVVGYEKSKEDCKRVRKRALPGDPPRIVELTLDSTSRPGDPRFLTAALAAIASRRDLLERFDLEKRLVEIEKQLESISDRRATWHPPRSPYHHHEPDPTPPDPGPPPAAASAPDAELFDDRFLAELAAEGAVPTDADDRRPEDPAVEAGRDGGGAVRLPAAERTADEGPPRRPE